MIFFDKVTKRYPAHLAKKENVVLDDVSFKVEKGEFVSITGKSGSGKTTIFRLILGEEVDQKERYSLMKKTYRNTTQETFINLEGE